MLPCLHLCCAVLQVVAPKQAALAQATSDLEVAQTALAGKQAELRIVVEQLEKLQDELRQTEERKDSLLKQVPVAAVCLFAAALGAVVAVGAGALCPYVGRVE